MSLRDRPGPGVQGFPFYLLPQQSLFMSNGHPRTWTGTTVGALVPLDDILEGLGKRSLGAGWWVGAQTPSPHPRYPIAQEDLKLMLPWGSLC